MTERIEKAACACLRVAFDPIELPGGAKRERWACNLCRAEFVRAGAPIVTTCKECAGMGCEVCDRECAPACRFCPELLRRIAELERRLAVLTAPRAPSAECTGIAAKWCPIHGDCSCPLNEYGERTLEDRICPLHGEASDHAKQAAPPAPSAEREPTARELIVRDTVARVCAWLSSYETECLRFAAEHITCNVYDDPETLGLAAAESTERGGGR